ncbi:hypothetical protein CI102_4814 [Trichoderma harzianum]|nr:hypothetical protein CI102_4814 [Trichoderma harzianum]
MTYLEIVKLRRRIRCTDSLETFAAKVVIAIGLGLLFGPMWWPQFVGDSVKRLGIITGFVLLFTAIYRGADCLLQTPAA